MSPSRPQPRPRPRRAAQGGRREYPPRPAAGGRRRPPRRSKGRTLLITLAVVLLLGAVVVGVGNWLNSSRSPVPGPGPGQVAPPQADQPADCPAVEVIAAPGTWESSPTDDPINPQEKPFALLLGVTRPLQQMFPASEVKVFTVPYTAQFRNINAKQEMTYDDSRTEGFTKVAAELSATHARCPRTGFILTGFSQGAVIMGDMVSDIGNGRGPVPAESVLGSALIADGRRVPGLGVIEGQQPVGVGAEVALAPINALTQAVMPGATMRGPREGGFGSLQDRTVEICASNDHICDTPADLNSSVQRALDIIANNGIHAQYATNPNVIPGTTAPQWVVQWASGLINARLGR